MKYKIAISSLVLLLVLVLIYANSEDNFDEKPKYNLNESTRELPKEELKPDSDPNVHVFTDVEGANMIGTEIGNFRTSSINWKIEKKGGNYELSNSVMSSKLVVKYARMEGSSYMYSIVGSNRFDGALVNYVLTSGKLSEYTSANGELATRVLLINFNDNTSLVYKLRR
jgi:hypothetical protein